MLYKINNFIALSFFSLFFLLIGMPDSFSQEVRSSKNKKAIKLYQKGYECIHKRNFNDAIKFASQAVGEDPNFTEAYIMIAESYSFSRKCEMACFYYQKAIESNPSFSHRLYLWAANENLNCGNPSVAVPFYEEHLNYLTEKNMEIPPAVQENYKLSKYRTSLMQDSSHFVLLNMGANINSPYDEYLPTLTADESIMIFTLRRPADEYTECFGCTEEEDFYISYQQDGEWAPRRPLGPPINTHNNEGAQCISPDGKYLIFTGCNRDDGEGSCDLYWSKREGNKWTVPQNMGRPVNTQYWESQPTFAADGKTILFASNRPGGVGGTDIWMTTMIEDGVFSRPINLGAPINTKDDEISPFFHPNGITLYFASNGHPGMGGKDIFYSNFNPNQTWSEPVNMGYPINTIGDEFNLIVNAKGDKAFFSSDKEGGFGKLDLYWFELPEKLRPQPVTYMRGKIFDANTKLPLQASFKIIDLNTEKTVISSTSDRQTGEFLICIPTQGFYALHAEKEGYLFYSENFQLDQSYSDIKPYEKNIYLKPIGIGESIVLENIFFDTDQSEIKPESEVELSSLLLLMTKNPNIKVEISGHTDNVGSKEHNLNLSTARAKAVLNYLVSKGVNPSRISYKGYGFSQPRESNDTEEGRSKNRRTEFKIMEK